MKRFKNPLELGARCELCPFSLNGKPNKPVLGEVPENPIGILVGEGPGAEEAACGRPFVGPTGRELDNSLREVGLDRRKLAVVNATCCKPTLGAGPDARVKAAQSCKPALEAQLEGIEHLPKFLMGTAAASSFMRIVKGGVDFMRGFVRKETNAIISWHPTYAFFRNPYQWAVFDDDLRRFKRLIEGRLENQETNIITEPTCADLKNLTKQGWVAVDIETSPVSDAEPWTGLDATQAALRSIQFGDEKNAVSFLWSWASAELRETVREILANKNITKVWCNGFWFDLRVLKRYNLESINNEDLRDMRCALSATAELSLRNMASQYTDLLPFKELGMDYTEK